MKEILSVGVNGCEIGQVAQTGLLIEYVVIDGHIAFLGGLDLCSARWDDRQHRASNPQRVNANQSAYAPFHDVQTYHVGEDSYEPIPAGSETLFPKGINWLSNFLSRAIE